MKIGFRYQARMKAIKMASGGLVLALFQYGAIGAEIPTDALKVAAGVVKAPDYETPPAKSYIVANATNSARLVQPSCAVVARIDHDGGGVLLETLEDALARFGKPDIFNTDQGSQFTGTAFTAVLIKNAIAKGGLAY